MNRTRWKLMIGGLGLSLAGLAAVAGVPEKTGGLSCTPNQSTHSVARVNPEPPISIPAPKVAEMPSIPAPAAPAPIAVPPLPMLPQAAPVNLPVPTLPPSAPVPVVPPPAAMPTIEPVGLPSVPQPLGIPAVPTPTNTPAPASAPMPQTEVPPVFNFDLPPPSAPVIPTAPPIVPPAAKPEPARIPPMVPDIVPVADLPPARTVTAQAPEPTRQMTSEPTRSIEKKLKVILHLGDERPKFEVRDTDEVYLKVTSERVEVKSPGDGGTSMSQMKAAGKVVFVTPGGEGTCDELVVVPGTGQVIVSGKVSFTYNWGKLETTVSGEKMTFRLGAPAVTAVGPGSVTGVPAGYQRSK